jgi:hypothetical protein
MAAMTTLIRFVLLCLMAGSAFAQSSLPPCRGDVSMWTDCFGTTTHPSGNKYVGEYKDGRRDGQGTFFFLVDDKFKGDKYVGEYKDGKPNGQGTYTFATGNKYVGEFKDDKPNGQGTYTLANGDKYVGEYKDDKRNGQGTYTFANGNKYVGEYKDDKRNGQGAFTLANGDKYVGEYKDGKRNGQGISYKADGTVASSGNWSDGNLVNSFALDSQRFPFNPPAQTTTSNVPIAAERDRLTAEVEAERNKRQEIEQQLASNKERERIRAELDAERRKRQDLEAQLVVHNSNPRKPSSAMPTHW